MSEVVEKIKWAMSLREPQVEALTCLDNISSVLEYKTCSKQEAEKIASEKCLEPHKISVDAEFDFPSFCFDMTTGIGKTRLMGACIYYLYKTKGYKHFFILAPGNTIYDKMRRETVPGHPKYMFKGLEAEMGKPKIYDGENYLTYPAKYKQGELFVEKTSDIEIFIFNISKIFTRGDLEFKFHEFNENLGASFSEVLKTFDDLVFCMDEAHRYYAPASKKAINYLQPKLGLEFTATPKDTNKNIIYRYGLEQGAGKFLKIPVVMGRTNTAGYSAEDIEEMKLKDGIKLHERRKAVVYKYCVDNNLPQCKPIVLVACKDTAHAKAIKDKIDSDSFFGGRYIGKVIEIDSSTSGAETEENIQKLLTIENNTNPIEIVLHVYKLKEGWDVSNLFTIIPLNAARSEILALQTIGRGLRLPFGHITGQEEIDTLDIVAHDHYREIIDDIKNNPIFKHRNLDDEEVEPTESVQVESVVHEQELSLFDEAFVKANITSFQQLSSQQSIEKVVEEYQKAFVKKTYTKKEEINAKQPDLFSSVNEPLQSEEAEKKSTEQLVSVNKKPEALTEEQIVKKIEKLTRIAISVPRIGVSYSSTISFKPIKVKRNIVDFDIASSKIERYDTINNKLLQTLDADTLIVDDPLNLLACSLLESIPELCADDADLIIDIVEQYLSLIEGDEQEKKKIIRRYATVIINDLREQIYAAKDEQTEFTFRVEKKLIIFGDFMKNIKIDGRLNYKKEPPSKKDIKKYLFEGYKKSFYPENGFDSDDERRFSVVLEDDPEVLRFIKPPLNQMGLYYKAATQYNPDFLVETKDKKYMIEVKAANQTDTEEVQEKARAGIKWCECASQVDADNKPWEYRLIPGDNIAVGNTFKYVAGMAIPIKNSEN